MVEVMLKIIGVSFIIACGCWFYVLAQGAYHGKYTRRVLYAAYHSAECVISWGIVTSAAAGLAWSVYDLLKGVLW